MSSTEASSKPAQTLANTIVFALEMYAEQVGDPAEALGIITGLFCLQFTKVHPGEALQVRRGLSSQRLENLLREGFEAVEKEAAKIPAGDRPPTAPDV